MSDWKKFVRNYHLSAFFIASFLIIFCVIILVLINFYELGEGGGLVIYVDALRELSVLGITSDLYKIIAFTGFMAALNLLLSKELMSKEPFLAYLLGAGTLLFSSLIFIVFIDIILIN